MLGHILISYWKLRIVVDLIQLFSPGTSCKCLELINNCFAQSLNPLLLGNALIDQPSIHIFDIGQHKQLFDSCIVPDISSQVWIFYPSLLCCLAK